MAGDAGPGRHGGPGSRGGAGAGFPQGVGPAGPRATSRRRALGWWPVYAEVDLDNLHSPAAALAGAGPRRPPGQNRHAPAARCRALPGQRDQPVAAANQAQRDLRHRHGARAGRPVCRRRRPAGAADRISTRTADGRWRMELPAPARGHTQLAPHHHQRSGGAARIRTRWGQSGRRDSPGTRAGARVPVPAPDVPVAPDRRGDRRPDDPFHVSAAVVLRHFARAGLPAVRESPVRFAGERGDRMGEPAPDCRGNLAGAERAPGQGPLRHGRAWTAEPVEYPARDAGAALVEQQPTWGRRSQFVVCRFCGPRTRQATESDGLPTPPK